MVDITFGYRLVQPDFRKFLVTMALFNALAGGFFVFNDNSSFVVRKLLAKTELL